MNRAMLLHQRPVKDQPVRSEKFPPDGDKDRLEHEQVIREIESMEAVKVLVPERTP